MRLQWDTEEWPRTTLESKIERTAMRLRKHIVIAIMTLVLVTPWIHVYFLLFTSKSSPDLIVDLMISLTLTGCLAGTFAIVEFTAEKVKK